MCVCGGDREDRERKFVVQRGSEEEKKSGDYQKKTSHSRVECHKIRFVHDATARTRHVKKKVTSTDVQRRQCSPSSTAPKYIYIYIIKKVASHGALPSPSAILLTGMTTVP